MAIGCGDNSDSYRKYSCNRWDRPTLSLDMRIQQPVRRPARLGPRSARCVLCASCLISYAHGTTSCFCSVTSGPGGQKSPKSSVARCVRSRARSVAPSAPCITAASNTFARGRRLVDDVVVHEMVNAWLHSTGASTHHDSADWYEAVRRLPPTVLSHDLDVRRGAARRVGARHARRRHVDGAQGEGGRSRQPRRRRALARTVPARRLRLGSPDRLPELLTLVESQRSSSAHRKPRLRAKTHHRSSREICNRG